jgi:hypothetical protein
MTPIFRVTVIESFASRCDHDNNIWNHGFHRFH